MSNKHIIYSSETLTLRRDFFVKNLLELAAYIFDESGIFCSELVGPLVHGLITDNNAAPS